MWVVGGKCGCFYDSCDRGGEDIGHVARCMHFFVFLARTSLHGYFVSMPGDVWSSSLTPRRRCHGWRTIAAKLWLCSASCVRQQIRRSLAWVAAVILQRLWTWPRQVSIHTLCWSWVRLKVLHAMLWLQDGSTKVARADLEANCQFKSTRHCWSGISSVK